MYLINKVVRNFFMQIIDENLPFSSQLPNVNRLHTYYNSLKDIITHELTGERTPIDQFYGHPFIHLNSLQQSFFTYPELKRLHKRCS